LLRARGHDALVAPLLRVEPVEADPGDGPWGALAATSANAIRALAGHPRLRELCALPLFVVGAHTAEAARAAGFRQVTSAEGNKNDLVRTIVDQRPGGAPLLYLAGEDRTGDLAGELTAADIPARMLVVYRAVAVDALPAEAGRALSAGAIRGVLHLSRRSAAIYLDRCAAAGLLDKALAPSHYCLSEAVAQPLAAAGARDIRVAAGPKEELLIDLVGI
jgi:uroporphyrinogen-III synthase